jgi:hypothetical protein
VGTVHRIRVATRLRFFSIADDKWIARVCVARGSWRRERINRGGSGNKGNEIQPQDESKHETLRPIIAELLQPQARLSGDAFAFDPQVQAWSDDQEWHDDENGRAGTHENRYLHEAG